MAEERVMFFSDRETFIVQSIMKKVEAEGIECEFATVDMKSLSNIKERIGSLAYFYIGDKIDYGIEALTYLRDLCTDNDCRLFLVGYESVINEFKDKVFQDKIAGQFYRPVNAAQLSEQVLNEIDRERSGGNKKHILLVDDSGTFLATVDEWLKDKYRVTPVNSALNALTFLAKEKPDLILLDYEMPACSGKKFLEMLRTDVDCSDIPVIFLTGMDDEDSVRSVLALKPAGYLLKSLPKETIVGEVDSFFARQKA